jgi:HTH-type transcriptional regulator / antitoxin MqsA
MSERRCGSCGTVGMVRSVRDVTREFRGQGIAIHQVDGWHCPACGEVEFASRAEASRFFAEAHAAQQAVIRSQAERIKAWRRRLGLTQKQAAEIFGGGVNAFSEYERGKTQPSKSTLLLLKILNKHPELLKDLT